MPRWTTSKDVSTLQQKTTATMRRAIYLCPLPSELFRIAPLVWLAEQCQEKGHNPLDLEFFAALKRNRKFLVEYVVFGMMKGREVIVAAKDWPENVLIALPSELEQISLARADYYKRAKPQRWVTERTAQKLVDKGMGKWGEDGMLRVGDILVGTNDRIAHDRFYSAPNQYTYWKPIEYPQSP